MSFNPLSVLNLKFRGRTVAVSRNQCSHYEVRPRPPLLVPLSPGLIVAPLATKGHHRGSSAQLPIPAGCSCRRYHLNGDSTWLSRDGHRRTVEGDLADGQQSRALCDDCS